MIRVIIADDHPVVRQGLKKIISETTDIVVEEEAGSGHEAIEKIRLDEFDVLLLDLAMPGITGLDTLTQIRKEKPRLPVLVLSVYPEEQYAVRALKAGASGYLSKSSAPDELVKAIRTIATGQKYITTSLSEKLVLYLQTPSEGRQPHEILSDREFGVLCLIAKGKTTGEIAKDLYLSPKTVSTYRARILDKMKMKNNAELMRYAIEKRLVESI